MTRAEPLVLGDAGRAYQSGVDGLNWIVLDYVSGAIPLRHSPVSAPDFVVSVAVNPSRTVG